MTAFSYCNYFLGKKMRFSGLNKEKHLRLVRTANAHYVGGLVHEGLEVEGPLATLKHPVNQAESQCFFRSHKVITLTSFRNFLYTLTGILS